MVKIVIENLGQKVVEVATPGLPVLRYVQGSRIDWMQACGAKGRCTTCRMEVVRGGDQLGSLTAAEEKYRQSGLLLAHERLACQAVVKGDVVIRVPEDTKLPHMKYTDSPIS